MVRGKKIFFVICCFSYTPHRKMFQVEVM